MEYGNHHHHAVPREEDDCSERSRPIRWSPKEEQVEILESIYNSGVINPPKDETTRITTLLQYYGPVVDANVFYWFQNRRSRSRRRRRQILIGQNQQQPPPAAGSPNYYTTSTGQQLSHPTPYNSGEQNLLSPSITFLHDDSAAAYSSSSSTPAINENICCSYPAQVCNLDIQRNSDQVSPDVAYNTTCPGAGCTLNVHYDQSAAGFISVYINGAATVVPMGPLDMKRMFGEQDFILIHSTSGMLVSNTSISSSLAHGESYFLVPAST